jgi:DNA-directed RNA polymerase specialized sigma subunit
MPQILTDLELIDIIKDGGSESSNAIREIISRHSGIFIDIINHYVPSNSPFCNKDDLIGDKHFYIYKAAMKYDPSRGTKFSTHLGNETKWLCLNTYNKNKTKLEIPSSDLQFDVDPSEGPRAYVSRNESYRKILEIIHDHPDDRVKTIFNMRYIEGEQNKVMPWKKISKELNMSIQGCINIHNSAVKKIKTKLQKEC